MILFVNYLKVAYYYYFIFDKAQINMSDYVILHVVIIDIINVPFYVRTM